MLLAPTKQADDDATIPIHRPVKAIGSFSILEGAIPKGSRNPCVGAIVVMVTATGVDDVPFSDAELGNTLHTDRAGAPVQVSDASAESDGRRQLKIVRSGLTGSDSGGR